jgi:uncharacterized delta-60 repeat protein
MQLEEVSVRPHNRAPILIEPLERRQLLAAGVLDPTFRSTGRFASSSGAGEFNDLAVAPDGSIFVASGSDRLTAYKFLPSGQPDTSFGLITTAGRVADIVVSGTNFQGAASLALQPDGKLILGGETFVNGTGDGKSVVARYTKTGATDTTWNGTGKIELSVPGKIQLQLSSVALQSDGKVVVIATLNSDVYVARLTTSGALDPTFDSDGYKVFSFPETNGIAHFGDHAYGGLVTPDGKILIVGSYLQRIVDPFSVYTRRGVELSRLNSDGSFDTTFDQDGMAVTIGQSTECLGRSVLLQADGKILVGAEFDGKPAVLRYNSNGSLDTSFDGDGYITLPGQAFADLALQSNGQIIAGAEAASPTTTTILTRLNSNGIVDTSFGTAGVATLSWSTLLGSFSTLYARDIDVQPDGKVLLGVSTDSGTDLSGKWGLARYLTDVPGPAIRGTVYGDWNDNGVVDSGETSPGVQVYLDSNHNDAPDSGEPVTTSDTTGQYKFADLALGTYDVREAVPSGYLALSPSAAERTVTIVAGDPGASADFTNRPTSPLPLVTGSNYLYDNSPNVVTFTFAVELDVNSLAASDLVLTRDGVGDVPLVQSVQWNGANNTATFVLDAGSLQNDAYHAALPIGSVTNVAGLANPIAGAADFFSLAGDGNRSRSVDIQDFNLLATNFGKSGMKFSQGNYDYSSDGHVTILDFNILASNFGKSVPQATTAMSASPSSLMPPAMRAPALRYDLLDEAQLI